MDDDDDVTPSMVESQIAIEVRRLSREVEKLRIMLISEPEQSPLGRYVIARADQNARRLDAHDDRLKRGDDRMSRIEGWVGIEDPPVHGRLPLITLVERLNGAVGAIRWQITLLTFIAAMLGAWVALGRPIP